MKYLTLIATIAIVTLPTLALAVAYTPLVDTGIDPNQDFDGYINGLYALSISIAALLAVIKIVIAGVKWMMTDIVTSKSEAKKDIQGALLGLLIVLGAVLIITVINPDILKVNLNLSKVTAPSGQSSSGGGPTATPVGSQALLPFHTVPSDTIYNYGQTPSTCSALGGTYYPNNGNGTPTCVVHAGASAGATAETPPATGGSGGSGGLSEQIPK